jgi:hypothetical protein
VSDTIHDSDGGDTDQGNWFVRNLWLVKGFAAAAVLVAFGFASLAVVGNEMGNVLWGISMTMAAFIVLVEAAFGAFQAANAA